MAFSELNDFSGSFSYTYPDIGPGHGWRDTRQATRQKHTEDHADYCDPEGVSVSQSSLSVVFDGTGKLVGERDVNESVGFDVTRNTYSAHSKFSENTQAEKVVDRTGKLEERDSFKCTDLDFTSRTETNEHRSILRGNWSSRTPSSSCEEEERRILQEEL